MLRRVTYSAVLHAQFNHVAQYFTRSGEKKVDWRKVETVCTICISTNSAEVKNGALNKGQHRSHVEITIKIKGGKCNFPGNNFFLDPIQSYEVYQNYEGKVLMS